MVYNDKTKKKYTSSRRHRDLAVFNNIIYCSVYCSGGAGRLAALDDVTNDATLPILIVV